MFIFDVTFFDRNKKEIAREIFTSNETEYPQAEYACRQYRKKRETELAHKCHFSDWTVKAVSPIPVP